MKLGETNRSESEEMYFGGKGINVSIVLRELGTKTLGFTAGVINGDYEYALRIGTGRRDGVFSDGLAEKDKIAQLLRTL